MRPSKRNFALTKQNDIDGMPKQTLDQCWSSESILYRDLRLTRPPLIRRPSMPMIAAKWIMWLATPAPGWSHLWSHPGTFSHVRVGLQGLPLGEAGHRRTRPIRRPQNSKAREGQPSAGSNPAATAN